MKKIRLTDLEQVRAQRPAGYVEQVLSMGTLVDGVLTLDDDIYSRLRIRYNSAKSELSFTQKLSSAAGAITRMAKATASGQKATVNDEEHSRRMAICAACEFFTGVTCRKCGCVAKWKTKLATEKCPVGEW